MKKAEILDFYREYKLFIFPAIVAISSLILIVLVIYPQITKLIANNKFVDETANKSKFLEGKSRVLESFTAADLDQKVNFVLGSYPTEEDFISAMGLLQNLISQGGFNALSISLAAGSANTQSYGIKLDILGSSSALSALINSIENSPRLMRVSSIETSNEKSSQATISLIINILYATAPSGFGSIDSSLPELSQKDEEILAKLASVSGGSSINQQKTLLGPRGKSNPFE